MFGFTTYFTSSASTTTPNTNNDEQSWNRALGNPSQTEPSPQERFNNLENIIKTAGNNVQNHLDRRDNNVRAVIAEMRARRENGES